MQNGGGKVLEATTMGPGASCRSSAVWSPGRECGRGNPSAGASVSGALGYRVGMVLRASVVRLEV
jgi:hypothetical protein